MSSSGPLKSIFSLQSLVFSTYVAGNYAYIPDLTIIDVADPVNPKSVGETHGRGGSAIGIVVSSGLAYVANHTYGLDIYDVSNPAAPSWMGAYTGLASGDAWSVALSGNYAFVNAENSAAIAVINVADPTSPTLAEDISPPILHFGTSAPHALMIAGNYLYVGDFAAAIFIYDISNPLAPTLTGTFSPSISPQAAAGDPTSPMGFAISGNYLYVADEATGLYVLDVSSPASPKLVGSYDPAPPGGFALYTGIQISGNRAFVVSRAGYLVEFDITNPASPTPVGTYLTGPGADAVSVASNYAYVSVNASGPGFGAELEIIDTALIPSSTAPISEVSVPSDTEWSDSGVTVNAGDQIAFAANGSAFLTTGPLAVLRSPAGDPSTTTDAQSGTGPAFAAPGLVPWSLVGKIGSSGTPFEIGAGTTISSANEGPLYLSVNDNTFSDNVYSWNVAVQVTPAVNHPPVNQPPVFLATSTFSGSISELPATTGSSSTTDSVSGIIAFSDPDTGDRPTASVLQQKVIYRNSIGTVFALAPSQVSALEGDFTVTSNIGNTNTGAIDWLYSVPDNALDFLGVGESLTITSTLQLDDHKGGTALQDATVTITGANDLPRASFDVNQVRSGATLSVDGLHGILANDRDPDLHDTLAVTAINGRSASVGHAVAGKYGTLTVNADGSYTYKAKVGVGSAAAPVFDTFLYTIADSHGANDVSSLTFSVSPTASGSVSLPFEGGPQRYLVTQGPATGDHISFAKWSYDFNLPVATPVLSVGTGLVVDVRDYVPDGTNTDTVTHPDASNGSGNFGNYVTVQLDDGAYVTYMHLAQTYQGKAGVAVQVGQHVGAGTILGVTGLTGARTGPHLHVEFGTTQYHSGGIRNDPLAKANGVANIIANGTSDKLAPEFFGQVTVEAISNSLYNADPGIDDIYFLNPSIRGFVVNQFEAGTDGLQISASGFGGGLTPGQPADMVSVLSSPATALHSGTKGYFIFETAGNRAGTVFWDRTGGSGADAVPIVRMVGLQSMNSSNIHILA